MTEEMTDQNQAQLGKTLWNIADHPPESAKSAVRTKGISPSLEAPSAGDTMLIARSDTMRRAILVAEAVARSPRTSTLILGESGAGKEVIAGYIHARSGRANAPFVRVNIAALPPTMMEAELFGSTRGSFTGSMRDRDGLVASADRGTILFDELGELDIALQPKLLRLVEEHAFYPVGADRMRQVDVRFLAATNRDPLRSIEEGRLRRDLYYRLAAVIVHMPPLRERREDILPLSEALMLRIATDLGRAPPQLDETATRLLLDYHWPGNVRELRNVLERALLMSTDGVLSADAFLLDVSESSGPPTNSRRRLDDTSVRQLREVSADARAQAEADEIRSALKATGGSATRTAQLLGISRTTLWTKLRKYRIT